MRLVFLGTAEFAVPALRACAARHEIAAVVTQPDKPGSRGRPARRPVADEARRWNHPILTPPRIRDPAAVSEILGLGADCLVVAAYGQILPKPLLEGPRHGAINVHASLLPRWRGAAPVAHAILAGDAETGVTIMQMDEGLDTGRVYATRHMPIPADAPTPGLTATLAEIGATLLVEVLEDVEVGTAVAVPQPEEGVTVARRLRRGDGELDWATIDALSLDRHVRALQPWPGVRVLLGGMRVRLLTGAVEVTAGRLAEPGTILRSAGESVVVAAAEGAFRVDRVHPPGARAMTAAAYLRGRRSSS